MSDIHPLPEESEYSSHLESLVDIVVEELGVEIDPDENQFNKSFIEANDNIEAGDHVLILGGTLEKQEVINAIQGTDAFKKALQGFLEYVDNERLTDDDKAHVVRSAMNSGGAGAMRTHAARLAYYELIDRIGDHPNAYERMVTPY